MISIIIPVYNGEKTLHLLTKELEKFIKHFGYAHEIIFVWDCGTDNSWKIIQEIADTSVLSIRAIKLTRNFGQHNAIIAGIDISVGEFIITMDEDLQHHPMDIELLLKAQSLSDLDVVYGKYKATSHSSFRSIMSAILRKLIQYGIPDVYELFISNVFFAILFFISLKGE